MAWCCCVARRQDELDRVVAEVRAAGGSAHGYPCDLTDAEATDDAGASGCCAEHDHVDMLVNNAGRSIRRSLEFSYDRMHDFERTMAINFFGPVRLTLGLLPRMRERRFGHVVNIVTWGVQIKAPKFAAYIASKTALDTFSRIAGRETFFDNVTFTNLRLDLVRTDMIEATDAYAKAPAKSPEQAALLVVRALEDRPLTISTLAGRVGELLNLIAPRAMDAGMAAMASRMPDSPRQPAPTRSESAAPADHTQNSAEASADCSGETGSAQLAFLACPLGGGLLGGLLRRLLGCCLLRLASWRPTFRPRPSESSRASSPRAVLRRRRCAGAPRAGRRPRPRTSSSPGSA